MILPRYFTAVASVDRDRVVSFLVRRALRLSRRPMIYALSERGLGQADLVLALLRVGTGPALALVERVVGRPVLHLRSQWLRWPINGVPRVSSPRLRIVATANPRRPNTPAHDRFGAAFRAGVTTIEQLRARGASKRDIRMARRRGWIEEIAA
jgi:hypothetical protein